MAEELSKGFTGVEINGVKFSNIREMLIYMNKQRDRIVELEQQIEEMKCCENCKFKRCNKSSRYQTCWYCKNKDKWQLGR